MLLNEPEFMLVISEYLCFNVDCKVKLDKKISLMVFCICLAIDSKIALQEKDISEILAEAKLMPDITTFNYSVLALEVLHSICTLPTSATNDRFLAPSMSKNLFKILFMETV